MIYPSDVHCVFEMYAISLGVFIQITLSCSELSHFDTSRPPQIEIDTACHVEDDLRRYCSDHGNGTQESITFKDNILTFNEADDLFVGISCVASYPVEWTHFQEKWIRHMDVNWLTLMRSQSHRFMRRIKTLDDSSAYTYTAYLGLHNLNAEENYAVGKYTCSAMSSVPNSNGKSSQTSTELSVFRTRKVYDLAFPLSGKNITVWTANKNDPLIFPCYIAYPNATVNLLRKKVSLFPFNFQNRRKSPIQSWKPVRITEGTVFIPDQGFVFDGIARQALPFGEYRCVLATDMEEDVNAEDFVSITYVQDDEPLVSEHKNVVYGGASFNYSLTKDRKIEITCCSNSSVPPNMYIIGCKSQASCEKQTRLLSQLNLTAEDADTNRLTKPVSGNCRQSLGILYQTYLPFNVKCVGEGIDQIDSFIFPFPKSRNNSQVKPYMNWDDVDPNDMLTLQVHGWNERGADGETILAYSNQTVKFTCTTNTAYFALGTAFTVDHTKGRKQPINDVHIYNYEDYKWGLPTYTLVVDVRGMTKTVMSVTCYAAMINSTQWIQKSLKIEVIDSKPVEMESNATEQVYWTLNDESRELSCSFFGIPQPDAVWWSKDDKRISTRRSGNTTHTVEIEKSSTRLRFHRIFHETQGEYSCHAKNMFGSAEKRFSVFVEVPKSHWLMISSVLTISCLGLVLLIIGYRTWRNKNFT